MIKRPKRDETEEDILRMQQEFLAEKAKNPQLKPAAQMVKTEQAPKKSLFAKSRGNQQHERNSKTNKDTSTAARADVTKDVQAQILGEIHEKIVGDINSAKGTHKIEDIVLGDIVEKHFTATKQSNNAYVPNETSYAFPKIEKLPLHLQKTAGKSLFAQTMAAKIKDNQTSSSKRLHEAEPMDCCEPVEKRNLSEIFGTASVIVEDVKAANEIHKENVELLSKMQEEEILAERQKLLETIDPTLVALLAKRRHERQNQNKDEAANHKDETIKQENYRATAMELEAQLESALPRSNAAVDLLQRSNAEHWIHFDVVEKDKLEWLRDIPEQAAKLKAGEKFEARFDWKGVLLPYTTEEPTSNNAAKTNAEKDERELYLHGAEPHRPGYTLQELFRLARSNIVQQRIAAFGAIAGILNIYNQGFYDNVLELPISKIFFLLRFGFDDNTPAMLEIVAKALAYLFYNETDETLLDFIYDNPGCHWQPMLQPLAEIQSEAEDPTSIENLQKQMKQLQMNANATAAIKANIEENEEESKTSMSDFQLAETDLIDCLLRTNILQRIYFILHTVRADNSTVSSCLKLLIRLARTSKEIALQIVSNEDLLNCLFANFLPGLERVDTTLQTPPFYNYPQYLCLKLMRILISQNLSIAIKLQQFKLVDKLQNYLFNREDIKGNLIKVQIEALRILRCLLLLRVDNALHKKFLPAFRYMLEWHFNHVIYEEGGPYLIRQHAAALLAALTSGSGGLEASSMLANILYDCCCSWFHKATRSGVKEFSQTTLLSNALNAVTWFTRNCGQTERFRNFAEKYLCHFIATPDFINCINMLGKSSAIVLHKHTDRRNIHAALPNVGAVVMHNYGPQLIIPQTYMVYLFTALWRLMQLQLEQNEKVLFVALTNPQIIESLVQYLREFAKNANLYLVTNFFAKAEINLIYKLLCFEGLEAYFDKAQMLQIVYKFLCCLTAEHIPEIEVLFERVLFNRNYIEEPEINLQKWRNTCLELVYPHYIIVPPTELTLSLPFTQTPILPNDWPYFQLKLLLQNYIENVQQKPAALFSENEILRMTLTFVAQLEQSNAQLQIVTPTEKLMYLMIAFMGPDSQFLEASMQQLLRQHILHFYEQCKDYTFQFDAVYEGKCKFENLYALFVDHFQAASYGDELFGSLLMIPLAQKYDNKWRRRVWSDYAGALRFLNCNENLLLGGLQAYLEPVEQEQSLLRAYANALHTNLVRPLSIPHKIASYHVAKFKESLQK